MPEQNAILHLIWGVQIFVDSIEEIFARANIQQISEFLLYGCDCVPDPRPYEERTEGSLSRVIDRLFADYPNRAEFEEMYGLVYACASAFEAVYMEIGVQVGALLAVQVCGARSAAEKRRDAHDCIHPH